MNENAVQRTARDAGLEFGSVGSISIKEFVAMGTKKHSKLPNDFDKNGAT